MNRKEVEINEKNNNSDKMYLYRNAVSGQWVAYGKSAYALRLWAKEQSRDSLRCFCYEMDMPSVIVSRFAVDDMHKSLKTISENDDMVVFELNHNFIDGDYLRWVKKLRNEDNAENNVDTGFVKDGMNSFERNVKRLCDFLVSSVALIVALPLFIICYILIKLDDGGPAIYAQERIGRFGRPFYIYKFRSMRVDSEKNGPQLSSQGGANDNRLTKIGSFLRAHHLDELPQLWNVFCGDMSFVGPRPERKYFIDQILEHDTRYTCLYQIRPGVTSYATIYNGYTDTMEKMLRRLEYDLYYLHHRTWWLDIKILWLTFWGVVSGRKL